MANKSESQAQADQQRLLAEALKQPGVADAVEAFGRVQEHQQPAAVSVGRSGYATGGNVDR